MEKKDTVTTKCYSPVNAGKTVKTSMGAIAFDARGIAEVTVDDDGLSKLAALGWLTEPTAEAKATDPKTGIVAVDALPRKNVSLYSNTNRGKTVKTSFGKIEFNAEGFASFDATEDDLPKLRALGWIHEPQPTVENAAAAQIPLKEGEVVAKTEEPKADDKADAKSSKKNQK